MFLVTPGSSLRRLGAPVASLTHEAYKGSPDPFMAAETGPIFRTEKYKGCAIQAASYKVGPREWTAEACFWQHTQSGWILLWIKSFEHLFEPQGLTFADQKEADNHAFRLARMLIDKTHNDLQKPASADTVSGWQPSYVWKKIKALKDRS